MIVIGEAADQTFRPTLNSHLLVVSDAKPQHVISGGNNGLDVREGMGSPEHLPSQLEERDVSGIDLIHAFLGIAALVFVDVSIEFPKRGKHITKDVRHLSGKVMLFLALRHRLVFLFGLGLHVVCWTQRKKRGSSKEQVAHRFHFLERMDTHVLFVCMHEGSRCPLSLTGACAHGPGRH